jgi:hypothetical protein
MRRPLGCLTFSAFVAVFLVLLGVVVLAATTGNRIFSPGPLSGVTVGAPLGGVTTHADLEGRCEACHAPIWSGERMADRCLVCHADVREQITAASGFHGRFASAESCRDCHTDHRGREASLIVANPEVFPHERTGYSLGAHALKGQGGTFGCLDCHPASPTAFKPPVCVACHEQRDAAYMTTHEQDFGTACLNCHDGVETYGVKFGHATYPLTGGHDGPLCGSCHHGQTTIAELKATSTACISCHGAKDIHQGRLGTACEQCHTPAAWTGATIDHKLTRFPLLGKHVGTACESCHVQRQWTGIGVTCIACHAKDDAHNGQFPGDCGACHVATGWKDVTFSHDQTGFKLAGAHASVTCAACHPNGKYANTPTTCIGCHKAKDKHNGTFGTDCGACHKVTTWADWTFDHAKSAFPLTGAHKSLDCQKCHAGGVFKGTPTVCASCHTRPASHNGVFTGACSACHTTGAWLPAGYNGPHPFPMNHGGAGSKCATCHPTSLTSYTCAKCHSDASMTSRHRGVGGFSLTSCTKCHANGGGGGD